MRSPGHKPPWIFTRRRTTEIVLDLTSTYIDLPGHLRKDTCEYPGGLFQDASLWPHFAPREHPGDPDGFPAELHTDGTVHQEVS